MIDELKVRSEEILQPEKEKVNDIPSEGNSIKAADVIDDGLMVL